MLLTVYEPCISTDITHLLDEGVELLLDGVNTGTLSAWSKKLAMILDGLNGGDIAHSPALTQVQAQ